MLLVGTNSASSFNGRTPARPTWRMTDIRGDIRHKVSLGPDRDIAADLSEIMFLTKAICRDFLVVDFCF